MRKTEVLLLLPKDIDTRIAWFSFGVMATMTVHHVAEFAIRVLEWVK